MIVREIRIAAYRGVGSRVAHPPTGMPCSAQPTCRARMTSALYVEGADGRQVAKTAQAGQVGDARRGASGCHGGEDTSVAAVGYARLRCCGLRCRRGLRPAPTITGPPVAPPKSEELTDRSPLDGPARVREPSSTRGPSSVMARTCLKPRSGRPRARHATRSRAAYPSVGTRFPRLTAAAIATTSSTMHETTHTTAFVDDDHPNTAPSPTLKPIAPRAAAQLNRPPNIAPRRTRFARPDRDSKPSTTLRFGDIWCSAWDVPTACQLQRSLRGAHPN